MTGVTPFQFWFAITVAPLATAITVFFGIFINNQLLRSEVKRLEEVMRAQLNTVHVEIQHLKNRIIDLDSGIIRSGR